MNFVLLCPRTGQEVIDAEYDDFLTFSGLRPDELEVRVLDKPDSPLGDFDRVTGVFIGGSPFTITAPHDDVWQPAVSARLAEFALDATKHRRFPIFAACYGASMFAHYLAGRVGTEFAEKAGISEINLTDAAQEDPLCKGLPSSFLGFVGHKDSVLELPDNATLLAGGPTCPVHLYRMGDNVWASQFHPEMNDVRIARRLSFYEDAGYCEPGKMQEVYDSLPGHDTSASNSFLRRFVSHANELAQQRVD